MEQGTITYEQAAAYARGLIFRAIRDGYLPSLKNGKVKCRDCPRPAERYDHRDYSKPFKVEPVCRGCNRARGPARFDPAKWQRVEDRKRPVAVVAKIAATRKERARLKEEAGQEALRRYFASQGGTA